MDRRIPLLLALALSLAIAGCQGPGPGPSDSGPPADSGFTPFSPTYAVLLRRCGGCHTGAMGVSGGLMLGDDEQSAYAALVGPDRTTRGACATAPIERVTPGDPAMSFLMTKISGMPPAGCGSQMPLAGGMLAPADLDTIRAWIEAGAPGPTDPL